jgi:hypothetical protein
MVVGIASCFWRFAVGGLSSAMAQECLLKQTCNIANGKNDSTLNNTQHKNQKPFMFTMKNHIEIYNSHRSHVHYNFITYKLIVYFAHVLLHSNPLLTYTIHISFLPSYEIQI